MNLQEITNELTRKNAKVEDNALGAFIKGSVEYLALRGGKLEDYALIKVNNPMQMKDNKVTVASQWRVIPVTQLEKVPEYED